MVFKFLENLLNLRIFAHAPVRHSKLQAEFFRIFLFLQQQKGEEKTMICFIKIQAEDDLEH